MTATRYSADSMTMSTVDEGAVYRIRVEGRLGEQWSSRLAEMGLVSVEAELPSAYTELTGRIADQAALMGVLEGLYSLGATLMRVERLVSELDEGAGN